MKKLVTMKNPILLTTATFFLLISAFGIGVKQASADSAKSARGVPPAYVSECVRAKDKEAGVTTSIFNSFVEIDTPAGFVEGLTNWFCVFKNQVSNMGMIDLATLGSDRSSIAATYLLKGLDLDSMGDPPSVGNPGTWVCEQLLGTSITRYTNGGFTSPAGEDEVCVFGDASKISIWVLIYVSMDEPGPDYLSIRKAVKSQPLEIDLPFLGDLPLPGHL